MLYNYEDIVLFPKSISRVKSRSECDTSVVLGNHKFRLPVIPANMKSVVDTETCSFLASKGLFYVMHRFDIDLLKFCRTMQEKDQFVSISIGINGDAESTIRTLKNNHIDPDFITLDVAHAWSVHVEPFVRKIKDNFSSHLIVGNLATCQSVEDVLFWGANSVKAGLGGGKCFKPGSLVKTNNGLKKIEDVVIGDEVFTFRNRFRRVTALYSRLENKRLISVNGIKCTENHEFYVLHKAYKDLVNDSNLEEYAEWIAAKDLTKDYFLLKMKFELVEIENISEESYDGTVYDLEVEDDCSYNIDGIIVHNSCITKNKTGFWTPMVSMLLEIRKNFPEAFIIADGGIRENGDVAKAIACGASMVMVGSMFSGWDQSAGQVIEINGAKYKEYYGNASEFTKGYRKHIEGKKILEPYKGDMTSMITEMHEDLQSAISYAGGTKLTDLRNVEIKYIR